MATEWDQIRYRWEHAEPVEGIAFLPNDRVAISTQSHRAGLAKIVALLTIHPEPAFEVEAIGGERLVLSQSELESPVPADTAECIAWIQKWYATQCDGDWEHENGLAIETLDNPGWLVRIDLRGTELETERFEEVARLEPQRDWLACKIEDTRWTGAGGPHMLAEILTTFVRWAQGTAADRLPQRPSSES